MEFYLPTSRLVDAMRHLSQTELLPLGNEQLRPVLACLSRFFLLSERLLLSEDPSVDAIWLRMHEFPEVNGVISLFKKVDFEAIAASIRTNGYEWITSNFAPLDGKSVVAEFEACSGDNYRRLGLVLYSVVNLKKQFDAAFTKDSILDQSDLWEILDCPTYWITVLHVLNVAVLELGEFFSVVDLVESLLFLTSNIPQSSDLEIVHNRFTFAATMAWWLVAAHPYTLTSVIERIFKWNLTISNDNHQIHRLSANRLSFISAYDYIFHQIPQLLHLSLSTHSISLVVLTFVAEYLSNTIEKEPLISANSELTHALAITSSMLTSASICTPGSKSCSLVTRLQWVAKHEQSALTEFNLLKKIRADLLRIITRSVDEWNASGIPPKAPTLSTTVHILSALQLHICLPRFVEQEVNVVASLFRVDFPHTPAHIEAVCEMICMSCACSELTAHEQFSTYLSNWLGLWRTSRRANLDSLSGIGELIIQIGLQCYSSSSPSLGTSHAQCQSALSGVLSVKLRLPSVTISSHQMTLLRKIFLSTILPESTLASSVLLVPSSAVDYLHSSLASSESGSDSISMLATTCVLILLRSPMFIKHQQHLQLKDWLLAQLKTGSLTLDPSFHLLLQNQTPSTGSVWPVPAGASLSAQQSNPLAGLVESEKLAAIVEDSCEVLFGSNSENLSEADIEHEVNIMLGILFYTLTSIDVLVTSGRNGSVPDSAARELPNLIALIDKIPVKVILFCIERSAVVVYSRIYPALIRLLYSYFPHICLVGDYLQLVISAKDSIILGKRESAKGKRSYMAPDRVMVERLKSISSEAFPTRPRHGSYLISILPQFLDTVSSGADNADVGKPSMFSNRQLSYATARTFANAFAKTAVAFSTTQIGRAAQELVGSSAPPLSAASLFAGNGDRSQHFVVEPLIFLTHLDKRVFRNPVILRIALWLYSRLLAANRQFFAHRIMVQAATNGNQQPPGPLPPGVLVPVENADTEAAFALDLLQQCESVAFLMEVCAKGDASVPVLVEVQSVICAFIHQLFLHNHQLVKLVHFQTYPLAAIPVAVALIPSIHVCLDFLPELLTTSSHSRQIFSILLLSHIATLYPMPRAFATAKLAVDVVDTMVTTMTADKRIEYFGRQSPVLEALKRLAACFPPLIEDIVHLILRVNSMTQSHKASSLVVASPWPRGVLKSNYRDVEHVRAELKATLLDIVRKTKLCKIFVV